MGKRAGVCGGKQSAAFKMTAKGKMYFFGIMLRTLKAAVAIFKSFAEEAVLRQPFNLGTIIVLTHFLVTSETAAYLSELCISLVSLVK